MCSSSEAVSAVFKDLGRTVSDEQGLKHLAIEYFGDENDLQESPLEQLALKCHSLQTLMFSEFGITTDSNRSRLLNFAGRAIAGSRSFSSLKISGTCSSVSDGAQFLQTLADSECNQLEGITI